MRYQQAIEIHERIETVLHLIETVLHLIETGEYSTPALADEIGVSIPTISRIVAALRERGHDIHAERTRNGWRYVLEHPTKNEVHGPQTTECKSAAETHYQRYAKG